MKNVNPYSYAVLSPRLDCLMCLGVIGDLDHVHMWFSKLDKGFLGDRAEDDNLYVLQNIHRVHSVHYNCWVRDSGSGRAAIFAEFYCFRSGTMNDLRS